MSAYCRKTTPKFMKKIILPIFAALAVSACSSITEDQITINSEPQGAVVVINNEVVGVTPATISLPRDGVYEVTLSRKGYKDLKTTISPMSTNDFIKFGLLVDAGYYKKLAFAGGDCQMAPDFLPAYKGTNAFADMQNNIDKVDELKKSGKISPEEHSYMIKKIVQFYSAK